jgi:hypothetical protein
VRWTVVAGLQAHPWVVATALTWWLVAALVWLLAPGAGRTAWSLLFWCALGLLVAVTLTPSLGSPPWWQAGTCAPQWPRTGFGLLAPNPERRWNVLLGVPLGLAALAWPAWTWLAGRRPGLPALAAVPIALVAPAAVELGQKELPSLHRLCAVVDVVDNLSGVLVGFVAAALLLGVRALLSDGSDARGPRHG